MIVEGYEDIEARDRRDRPFADRSHEPKQTRPLKRFPFTWFDDLKVSEESSYLVKGIIPRAGLTVVWGPPKCGKSFKVFDMMTHVACGWEYRGRKTRRGPVIYCAMEGASGFGARQAAFRSRFLDRDHERVPLALMPTPMTLVADAPSLISSIRGLLEGKPPVAVVLDTLNRSLAGSESKDEDMAAYVRAADSIRYAFDCAVIVVHHCGISGDRPRGHTSLTGAADAQLAVKRDGTDNIVLTVEFMKDGPEGESIVSRLESVDVGIDEDGDPITSCVVISMEHEAASSPVAKRKMNNKQKLAVEALANVILDRGAPIPVGFGIPGGGNCIQADLWRDELFSRGILDRLSSNPRQDFRRLRQQLAVLGIISERDDLVWRV